MPPKNGKPTFLDLIEYDVLLRECLPPTNGANSHPPTAPESQAPEVRRMGTTMIDPSPRQVP